MWRWMSCLGLLFLLPGCASNVFTGANLIYDRHHVYVKLNDFQLGALVNRALYKDQKFKCASCYLDVAVFNRDILLMGHVPTVSLRNLAAQRINAIPGQRRFFNQLNVSAVGNNTVIDGWITAKIRSRILANADIDPQQFKIVTCDRIVYLMGDVIPEQAFTVINYARQCSGVKRVVRLFRYYNLSDRPINLIRPGTSSGLR